MGDSFTLPSLRARKSEFHPQSTGSAAPMSGRRRGLRVPLGAAQDKLTISVSDRLIPFEFRSAPWADHSLRFIFILFVFKYITNFENLLFDNRMVLLDRERELRTGSAPMENCRRRQSSSISVLLPTGAREGFSEAGIDSMAEFRGLMQHGHPRCETLRSVPPKKGSRAVTISFSEQFARARVCLN